MSQNTSPTNGAAVGAFFMVTAAVAFAGTNVLQSVLPTPVEYGGFGMASTGMAFWQYVIAAIVSLPLIFRIGLGNLRTSHPLAHEVRAFTSALGVHVFVYGFASGVPIWQMVTLLALREENWLGSSQQAYPGRAFPSLSGAQYHDNIKQRAGRLDGGPTFTEH